MANSTHFKLRYCERGHVVTSYDPRFGESRCAMCGKVFVDRCPSCDAPVDRGWESPTYVGGKPAQKPPDPPGCCTKCGNSFPWTKNAGGDVEVDAGRLVRNLCEGFPLVVRELGRRHDGRTPLNMADEYDVQDLFRALLRLYFDDVRAEEDTPSFAGKAGRIDFLIKGDSIGIEVKKTRRGLTGKKVGDELIIDMSRYQSHPSCKLLICFVYDPEGLIENPDGLAADRSKLDAEFRVEVVVAPRRY